VENSQGEKNENILELYLLLLSKGIGILIFHWKIAKLGIRVRLALKHA
jgi:hypothetical protein